MTQVCPICGKKAIDVLNNSLESSFEGNGGDYSVSIKEDINKCHPIDFGCASIFSRKTGKILRYKRKYLLPIAEPR